MNADIQRRGSCVAWVRIAYVLAYPRRSATRTKSTWALALIFAAPPALAQTPLPVGFEFLVNTYTTDRQLGAAIAAVPGGFVVVWESRGSSGGDTSSSSIQGQRLARDAGTIGSEFQINTYATGGQGSPALAFDPGGDFVVVWASSGSPGDDTSAASIQGQRFAADASPIGLQFQVNTYTTAFQQRPVVAVAPAGDFVVVWDSYGPPDGDPFYASIQGQHFARDASPLGPQFQVNSFTPGSQLGPALAMDSTGDFVVVWTSVCCDDTFPLYWSIRGQRFASDASPLGSELQITTTIGTNVRSQPAVAMDSAGDFIVVWESRGSPGNDTWATSVQGQRFAADAIPLGSQFQVNTYTTNYQQAPAVALDPAGDFVVVWRSLGAGNGDPSSWSVQGQRFQVPIFADGFESGDTTAWSKSR